MQDHDTARSPLWRHPAFPGALLVVAALLAMIASNTGWAPSYNRLLETRMGLFVDEWNLAKPALLWINDGLMAVFFLLVGLELKRELLTGQLADRTAMVAPVVAALGGMVVPAAIYASLNVGGAGAHGWAIPAATDIAFALGVLSLLGSRVPLAAKVFLTAVAVIDDLGAIIIIALFYTDNLSGRALAMAAICVVGLVMMNRAGVRKLLPYLAVGALLWLAVLRSGVHATLAGVILGLCIPLARKGDEEPPLLVLEHVLTPWVTFLVLPVFAFANAGVSFSGLGAGVLLEPVTLGIALGLIVGKPAGVYGLLWLANRARLLRLPDGLDWQILLGVALLCGIGFTMSLFIGTLAFGGGFAAPIRVGVLGGSVVSALLGLVILRRAVERRAASG